MAFTDAILKRVELVIKRMKPELKLDVPPTSKLGVPPIGFDDFKLEEFRGHLNGNHLGFGDLLTRPIARSDVTQSTQLKELVSTIVAKSSIESLGDYEVKMGERVRLGLRHHIARLADPPVDEQEILPTKAVRDYALAESSIDTLRERLTEEFRKYLLSAIRRSDLDGSINVVRNHIVLRMLA